GAIARLGGIGTHNIKIGSLLGAPTGEADFYGHVGLLTKRGWGLLILKGCRRLAHFPRARRGHARGTLQPLSTSSCRACRGNPACAAARHRPGPGDPGAAAA